MFHRSFIQQVRLTTRESFKIWIIRCPTMVDFASFCNSCSVIPILYHAFISLISIHRDDYNFDPPESSPDTSSVDRIECTSYSLHNLDADSALSSDSDSQLLQGLFRRSHGSCSVQPLGNPALPEPIHSTGSDLAGHRCTEDPEYSIPVSCGCEILNLATEVYHVLVLNCLAGKSFFLSLLYDIKWSLISNIDISPSERLRNKKFDPHAHVLAGSC